MLSGSPCLGKYPVESVKALDLYAMLWEANKNGESHSFLKTISNIQSYSDNNPIRGQYFAVAARYCSSDWRKSCC